MKHKPAELYNEIITGKKEIVPVSKESMAIIRKYYVEVVGSNQNELN